MNATMLRLSLPTFLLAAVTAQDSGRPGIDFPVPAYSTGCTFDSTRGALVLFGGTVPDRGPRAALWSWSSKWAFHASPPTETPEPRNAPALAFDAKRGCVVLFGGDGRSGPLGDTWEWDGTRWQQRATEGPAARTLTRLAYDPERNAVVMFGGVAGSKVFGDTWTWDGKAWRLLVEQGPPRQLHGMAHDPVRKALFVFGGSTGVGEPGKADPALLSGETWTLAKDGWRLVTDQGPGARDHVALAFDPMSKQLLVHGGFDGQKLRGDTWGFDGKVWKELAKQAACGDRSFCCLATDTKNKRLVLFGGFDATGPKNDVWAWGGKDWVVAK